VPVEVMLGGKEKGERKKVARGGGEKREKRKEKC